MINARWGWQPIFAAVVGEDTTNLAVTDMVEPLFVGMDCILQVGESASLLVDLVKGESQSIDSVTQRELGLDISATALHHEFFAPSSDGNMRDLNALIMQLAG